LPAGHARQEPTQLKRESREEMMKTQTLFSAFAAAQTGKPSPARAHPDLIDDSTLLNALRNSATDRDQILQRRVGIYKE
jgi:hypothetical protein